MHYLTRCTISNESRKVLKFFFFLNNALIHSDCFFLTFSQIFQLYIEHKMKCPQCNTFSTL